MTRTLSLPDQTGHVGEVLHTNGTNTYWAAGGGGGGGVVDTLTGVEPISIDATDPANLIASLDYDGTLFINPSGELSVVGGTPALTSLVATTTVLPGSPTYANGVSGVGATLTRTGNGAIGTIDGVSLIVGSRILVKDQVSTLQNGIYEVTALGSAGAPYVITRTTDSDESAELTDQTIVVSAGTVNKGLIFTQTTDSPVIGTDPIVYANISTLYVTQQSSGTQVAGQIPFYTSTARQISKGVSQLFWDNVNKRLGLGTTTPQQQLQITGAFRFPATTGSTVGVFYKDADRFIHTYIGGGTNENLFIGRQAGNFTLAATSNNNANIGIGNTSLDSLTTGYRNTMMGFNAGTGLNSGFTNTGYGFQVMRLATSGNTNNAFGSDALGGAALTGTENSMFGSTAGYLATSASRNSGFGNLVFVELTTGVDNTAIGYAAGNDNETGSRNTYLGALADKDTTTATQFNDSIAIGYAAKVTASNQMVVGSDSTNIDDIFLGRGFEQATPGSVTIHATGGSGTDITGADMTFAGGIATGDAVGGDLHFQTSVPGVSGTTPQSLETVMSIFAEFEKVSFEKGQRNKITITGINYTILQSDFIIGLSAGSITADLPASPSDGDTYIIKDMDGSGNQVVDGNGHNIDTAGSVTFTNPFESITVVYSSSFSEWQIISHVNP